MNLLTETGWAPVPVGEPALAGEVTCDVAVVGGGVGGMTAALRLAESGADVVLLEAQTCGWGASSRNAGYVTNSIAADPSLLALLLSRSKVRALFQFAEAAVEFTQDAIEHRAIDCDFEKVGIVLAAVSKGQLRKSRRNAKILSEAGSSAEFVDGRDAGLPDGFLGGVREGIGGTLNPGKYAMGLRDAVLASGVRVFEHTPVQNVTDGGAGVTVETAQGRVRAKQALLTANANLKDFAIAPRRLVSPVWTSLVETEPVAPERLDAIGWTSRAPMVTAHMILESYRVTPRNTIVFGTRRLETTNGPLHARTPSGPVVDDLVRGFRERFPGLSDVAPQRAWGGWIGMSSTWLPVAGEAAPNVLYSLACNGHGFAQAQYVGNLLADRLSGAPMPDDLKTIWHDGRFWPSFVSQPALTLGWFGDRVLDRLARI
ncbi:MULTISPECIES: NAD(P)/FAD-dependent oxidoreductase [Mycobacteriaceae]|uniref:FAD-binding oxidoreductase n=1 Tax=Mycolicibacterium mucogenicum DSM 44124 TaxID=1226753 RepID=A0A8H2JD24_MYCMU|nr:MULTISPECIES: FAD-binding oxidoreductase [Mycobacteriaceae]KAB7757291.1 oxidoreductase [Mycolicibacterium mucogenicum DSM 44124]QPG67152.1 FAD-binding oxidoreductase [Mycolicibacterium mucogenicum DSM 44124]SEA62668.1 Glycine/D-amino acid oxidase [Mycobacterium sp. 283mftsu]